MEEVTRTPLTHLSIEMVTLTHGHIKMRAQRFSPSMPETELTKVITGPNLEERRSVRRSGTTSRGTALLVFG